ncbi:dihydroorotate dehydrogenase (quinone) [Longispora fulva]|uniref:Dihydroorotate dehydrogenase (quinone) n=1 Tax=Longispora fulva TaxID=619741 RepID=A0A8J7KKY6_9ACTN|nr:quinone-dependent dihydroorotate dehydrogenase [Longispora fulva]MBG6141825.1 dihydroorotate dehydrogenase [Longispora fulva]GIG59020.1 dihydroorotate dehydrogenase (quinone) [Longispora fulva]
MIYEKTLRPVLFRLQGGDAERVHEWTMRRLAALAGRPRMVRTLQKVFSIQAPRTLFGVRFPSPVGLAAGMDKDGHALPAWPALGFGFVEVGTVTRHAQPGNDRPRLFRLRESEAIVNRMGFNNAGAQALATRLARLGPLSVPLGISLGKSKVTPLEAAAEDYAASYAALKGYGDYFAVNVSSPNTPGLRALQDRAALGDILAALRGDKPILVKIAPDLTDHAIGELLDVCAEHGVAGLIATNTTLGRGGLAPADRELGGEAGGLSGRPLTERAREVVALVSKETGGRLPIIGVGGLGSPDDALRMLDAGASLLQLYTGFIYHGPPLVRAINRAVAARPTV